MVGDRLGGRSGLKCLDILVVDDDVDNARSLGELFELEGHRATVVHSGEAAIAAFRRQRFDIAFMDVMMPGKNGVESFLEIRRQHPDARVYMMTGYSVEQLLRQAMANGALGVISKPLDPAKVLGVLVEVGRHGIVVVADDDPGLGPRLERMLGDAGLPSCLVQCRGDCARADAAAQVLIFDIKAPLIDGVDLYAEWRRAGHVAPAIIITKSGPHDRSTVDAMHDVAISGILNKPFDPMTLLDQLSRLAA
jgi:two-component system, NtrC family, response regulator HydG